MITLFLLHPVKQIPVQVWSFENESVIRIGRSTDNHVILYSAVVSRHHVELRRTGDTWEIVNLGTNGTYLEGKRITQVPAVDGAIIRLARSGPNIQIRLGAEALKDLPETLTGDRTLSQKPEHPISDTEIRERPSVNEEEEERKKLGSEARERASPLTSKGVIPVPPHLQLSTEAGTKIQSPQAAGANFASAVAAARIMRTLGAAALTNPRDCTHPRRDSPFCPDCGQPLHVLHTVGDYQLVQVLGQGTIGITYLAWCRGQTLVLKTLNHNWLENPKAHAALEYEAEVLQQLNHPQIPHLIDFFSASGQPYLVMEVMRGQNLAQWVAAQGGVSVGQAIAWMLDVCEVLNYLHDFTPPLLHRGIRPNNLIAQGRLSRTGKIAVVDFGAVKTIALEQSIPVGSTAYAAPEQLALTATPTVDLYALGPTLAYLLTGQNPVSFYSDRDEGYRFYAESVPGIPDEMVPILHRLTEPDPVDRYPSARSLIQDLSQILVNA